MLALLPLFEQISNVRRLFNRFSIFSKSNSTKIEEDVQNEDQRDILLGPVLNHMREDKRVIYFEEEFREELEKQTYFARELDACLLEMKKIERDLYDFKQRQCSFYERHLDFLEKKDQLIDEYIEYHEEYIFQEPLSPRTKQLRKQSMIYEFNIPIANRFELFERQQT